MNALLRTAWRDIKMFTVLSIVLIPAAVVVALVVMWPLIVGLPYWIHLGWCGLICTAIYTFYARQEIEWERQRKEFFRHE